MARKTDKPKNATGEEIVVFSVIRETQCTECGAELWKGSLLRLEGEKALCTDCCGSRPSGVFAQRRCGGDAPGQ